MRQKISMKYLSDTKWIWTSYPFTRFLHQFSSRIFICGNGTIWCIFIRVLLQQLVRFYHNFYIFYYVVCGVNWPWVTSKSSNYLVMTARELKYYDLMNVEDIFVKEINPFQSLKRPQCMHTNVLLASCHWDNVASIYGLYVSRNLLPI